MKTLRFLNVVAMISTLIVNALSQIVPFNNQTSAQIANSFDNNYFLPANYVFGIWSLIYVGLIAFAFYQARQERPVVSSFGGWFIASGVFNCVWLFCFHWNLFALSMIPMVLLLVSLIVMYRKLRTSTTGVTVTNADRIFVGAPISIYLGWITVATIANATYVLLDAQWSGFGISYEMWGAIMIVVGGLIGGAFAFIHRDAIYAGVIVWAFAGIVARHPDVTVVALSAGILAVGVGLIGIFGIVSWLGSRGSTPLQRGAA
ncbi:MAG: TspO/MBR family protein [Chloroflexota bacterium]|nr:TspO/MBR family protein [Chloroflexota bacterium]